MSGRLSILNIHTQVYNNIGVSHAKYKLTDIKRKLILSQTYWKTFHMSFSVKKNKTKQSRQNTSKETERVYDLNQEWRNTT